MKPSSNGSGAALISFPCSSSPDLEVSNLLITGKSTSDPDFYEESRAQVSDSLSINVGPPPDEFWRDFNHVKDDSSGTSSFPARIIFPQPDRVLQSHASGLLVPYAQRTDNASWISAYRSRRMCDAWQSATLTSDAHNAYDFLPRTNGNLPQRLTLPTVCAMTLKLILHALA